MKSRNAAFLVFLLAFCLMVPALAVKAEEKKPGTPAVVTTCGKSPGALMIRLILKRAQIACDQNDDLTAADLSGGKYKTVIITMGTSGKGMGAAGTDIDAEAARVKAVIAEARKQGMTIIGAHVEGMARRTDNADQVSIDAVGSACDILVYTDDGNTDGLFSKMAEERKIKSFHCKEKLELVGVFKQIF